MNKDAVYNNGISIVRIKFDGEIISFIMDYFEARREK